MLALHVARIGYGSTIVIHYERSFRRIDKLTFCRFIQEPFVSQASTDYLLLAIISFDRTGFTLKITTRVPMGIYYIRLTESPSTVALKSQRKIYSTCIRFEKLNEPQKAAPKASPLDYRNASANCTIFLAIASS
jgi:hypothetical protein